MGLFSPGWDSSDETKALAAAGKLRNAMDIKEAALNGRFHSVRMAAAQRAKEPSLLDIALRTVDHDIFELMLERLSDQSLAEIVTKSMHKEQQKRALEYIKSADLLLRIANDMIHKNTVTEEIKKRAVSLTDEEALKNAVLLGRYTPEFCIRAVKGIKDQRRLMDIIEAENKTTAQVKAAAVDGIFEDALLIGLANRYYSKYSFVGSAAFDRIKKYRKTLMKLIADEDTLGHVRTEALQALCSETLSAEEARTLLPFLDEYHFYVMLILSNCKDEVLCEMASDKMRFIERHAIKGAIESARYVCTGCGVIEVWSGAIHKTYTLDGTNSIEINLYNGDMIEQDWDVTLKERPYSAAEQGDYAQYLYACKNGQYIAVV